MAKTSALGLGLQRFVECTLCDIADAYLGARAIVDPPRQGSDGAAAVPGGEQITVSFDLVIGHGEGREAVRVLNGAELAAAADNAVSRIRFELPLSLPGPLSPVALSPVERPAVPDTADIGEPALVEPTVVRPDDPIRAKVQDPEDLALM